MFLFSIFPCRRSVATLSFLVSFSVPCVASPYRPVSRVDGLGVRREVSGAVSPVSSVRSIPSVPFRPARRYFVMPYRLPVFRVVWRGGINGLIPDDFVRSRRFP